MNAGVKLFVWLGASTALTAATAPNLPALVGQSAGDAFGGLLVAIPIVALLTVVFALRWREFAEAADQGRGESLLAVRILGATVVGALIAAVPLTGQSLAASGTAVVLTFYGTALAVLPSAWRFMLPYAAVYVAAAGAPAILLWAFGEPLAGMSSVLSAKLAGVAGFPVAWQGTQFELVSKTGEVVSGAVTSGCSSVTSVSMFLGLLALMHLDMKKDVRSTAKLAAAGVAALTLLNSVRIMILLWVGYEYGSAALWGVHDWLGYAIFLGFFLAALPVYVRMGGPLNRARPASRTPAFPA